MANPDRPVTSALPDKSEAPNYALDHHDTTEAVPEVAKIQRRARHGLQKAKSKVKRVVKPVRESYTHTPVPPLTRSTPLDPAFDPSSSKNGAPDSGTGSVTAVIRDKLQLAGKIIKNPAKGVQREIADKSAVSDQLQASTDADREYLDAHDEHAALHSSQCSISDLEERHTQREQCRKHIEELDEARDSRKVASTTKRIQRVVVRRYEVLKKPVKDDFYRVDKASATRSFDRQAYVLARARYVLKDLTINVFGNIDYASHHAFDRKLCQSHLERLAIASAPWQVWFLSLRKLYLWEDPRKTGFWAAVWFLVWWLDFEMTFCMAWIVYIVLASRFSNPAVDALRDSLGRTRASEHDPDAPSVLKLDELILKHGPAEWFDPLLDAAGPTIQMLLSDMADLLEVLRNFYDWRAPEQTIATLFWFCSAILFGALTPRDMSVKFVWMMCLLWFFLGMPIASKNPRYRHALNIFGWILWGIPNNAEWAIMALRSKAVDFSLSSPQDDATSWHTADSVAPPEVYASLKCRDIHGSSGHLTIETTGIHFQPSSHRSLHAMFSSKPHQDDASWTIDWASLISMTKTNEYPLPLLPSVTNTDPDSDANPKPKPRRPSKSSLLTTQGLEFAVETSVTAQNRPRTFRLRHVDNRDMAFNCVLGFSGLDFLVAEPSASSEVDVESGKNLGAAQAEVVLDGEREWFT